jgi:hypothetical protein
MSSMGDSVGGWRLQLLWGPADLRGGNQGRINALVRVAPARLYLQLRVDSVCQRLVFVR